MKKILKSKVLLAYVMAALLGVSTTAIASTTGVPAGGSKVDSTFKVGNVTQNVNYTSAVNAKIDDVVRYEIWYHNTELADSGKNATNLNVKVSLPSANATSHVATAVVGGTNTNVTTNTTSVVTAAATTLDYIPGTAYRRYNTGTNAAPVWKTEKISDSVMTASGYTINSMKPCWNFQETITVQARVRGSVVSINKQVKIDGGNTWFSSIDAKPGDVVAYLITIKNEGNTNLTNVMVRDSLPPRMDYIEGSAKQTDSNFPNGHILSDLLIAGGVNTGNYAPGSVSYVRFTARVPENINNQCYVDFNFKNVAIVKPEGMVEFNNSATVIVDYPCTPVVPPVTPPVTPPTTVVVETGKGSTPVSGPAEAAAGAVGLAGTSGAAYAWLRSKKALLSAITKIK